MKPESLAGVVYGTVCDFILLCIELAFVFTPFYPQHRLGFVCVCVCVCVYVLVGNVGWARIWVLFV